MSTSTRHSGSLLGEFTALTLAPPANQLAEEARKARAEYRKHKIWVETFDSYWNSVHLSVHAFICLSATICSFIFGWDMYSGFVANVLGLDKAPWQAIAVVSCFLSGFAIFTSLFATRVFSPKIQGWILQQESRSGGHGLILQHRLESARVRDLLKFAAMSLLSSFVILLITWQRYVWLLQEVDGDSSLIDYTELLIPFASYIFEVISGEMAILWVERNIRWWQMRKFLKKYKQKAAKTADLDKKVAFHWHTAMREGETLLMLADIQRCLYRAQYRSTDDDIYVDECPGTHLTY